MTSEFGMHSALRLSSHSEWFNAQVWISRDDLYCCIQSSTQTTNQIHHIGSILPKGPYLPCIYILPKGPYLPCISMAGRALLAGYHRYLEHFWDSHTTFMDRIPTWLQHSIKAITIHGCSFPCSSIQNITSCLTFYCRALSCWHSWLFFASCHIKPCGTWQYYDDYNAWGADQSGMDRMYMPQNDLGKIHI